MKFLLSLIAFILVNTAIVKAEYLEDVKSMGYVSGEGIACGARRYKAYETIARAYLVSAAKSDTQQAAGMDAYNEAKARAYLAKRHDGLYGCDEINQRFNQQKIFAAKLYKNGKLKMPDGKIFVPRQEYDATQLYDKDSDEREVLNEKYDRIMAKKRAQAQKEGIYEKIKKAERERY